MENSIDFITGAIQLLIKSFGAYAELKLNFEPCYFQRIDCYFVISFHDSLVINLSINLFDLTNKIYN